MLQVVTDTSLGFNEQEEADSIKSLEKVNAIPKNLIIPLHVKRFVLPNGQSPVKTKGLKLLPQRQLLGTQNW